MSHWLTNLFSHPDPVGACIIAGKTALIYVFLVAGLRLLGKRELGQMTIYDLVLIIVLANSVQNAMVGSDTTLLGGITAGTTLLVLNRIFTLAVSRSRRLRRAMIGQPMLILNDGHLITERLKREGITREQVMAALREHGITRLEDAHMAVLEVDGTISVVPQASDVFRTRHHYRALRLG
jgi:uncharacterized membrane protein YcaP (DUF421 family)